jgi:hypothetical protein
MATRYEGANTGKACECSGQNLEYRFSPEAAREGVAVIWDGIPFETPVNGACRNKAGHLQFIHFSPDPVETPGLF